VLALLAAGAISLLWPNSVEEYAGFVWILALIPVFLLSYYRGWSGAAAACAGAMVALTFFEVVIHRWLAFQENWLVVGGATVVLVPVTLGAGWLSERFMGAQEQERRLHELAPVPIIVHAGATVRYANRAALRLVGVDDERSLVGSSVLELIHLEDRPRAERRLEQLQDADDFPETRRERFRIVRPDGGTRTVEVDSLPVLYGHERAVQTIVRDITERVRMERQLEHRALYDPLTGLPNRQLFTDRAEQAVARAGRQETPLGLLFLDLDGFKEVNDTLGHDAGDRVLAEVARRLTSNVREEDTVARYGGDEFIVLLEDLEGRDEASRTAERVVRAFNEPFHVEGDDFRLPVSVGVLVRHIDEQGDRPDPGALVQAADVAMFRAKEQGGNRYHLFDPASDAPRSDRVRDEERLAEAIEEGEFLLHFQPIVRLEDGSVVGMEPLARWRRGEDDLVPPADFIPLAEETGLIVPLGRTLFREACRHMRGWGSGAGRDPVRLHPNLSARQLAEPGLVESLARIAREEEWPAEWIVFELTESDILQAPTIVERLKETGASVMMDDFGTGYSSLNYLRELPVDGIKLDLSFVHRLGRDRKDDAVVEAVIDLGNALDLPVTAEGVETEEQARRLSNLGCPFAQGSYFSNPLSPEEVAARLGVRSDEAGDEVDETA
jgi:diguanylate cyclase (GGDEF)-like protein/PAS domain S-box-containing protein